MKKDQNLPNKTVYSNDSSRKPLPSNQNYSINQPPYNSSYRGRSPEQRNSRNFSQNRYSRSNSRNNYPRSNSNSNNSFQHPVFIQTQEIDTIPTIDQETHRTIEIEAIQTIGIEVTQTIEIKIIQTIDHEITRIIDRIIKDRMITTKTDQELIHKIDTKVTTIDVEMIPNHLIGIIIVTPFLNIDTEVIHQNIKDKSTKYKQMTK